MRFEITEKQQERINNWLKGKDLSVYTGAIGGRLTYSFTPTSLGIIEKVFDSVTNDELDVTEYDLW